MTGEGLDSGTFARGKGRETRDLAYMLTERMTGSVERERLAVM
jgi:hypothetical protein